MIPKDVRVATPHSSWRKCYKVLALEKNPAENVNGSRKQDQPSVEGNKVQTPTIKKRYDEQESANRVLWSAAQRSKIQNKKPEPELEIEGTK